MEDIMVQAGNSASGIPETGYLRQHQILGDKRRGIPPIYPVSKSTWWAGFAGVRWYGSLSSLILSIDPTCRRGNETTSLSVAYQGQSSPAMEV